MNLTAPEIFESYALEVGSSTIRTPQLEVVAERLWANNYILQRVTVMNFQSSSGDQTLERNLKDFVAQDENDKVPLHQVSIDALSKGENSITPSLRSARLPRYPPKDRMSRAVWFHYVQTIYYLFLR